MHDFEHFLEQSKTFELQKLQIRSVKYYPQKLWNWVNRENRNFQPELSVYDNFNIRAEYFNDAGADFKVRNEKDRKNIFLKFIPFRFEIDNSCVWE